MEGCYCFGLGEEVIVEAVVAVFVGDYGLDLDGSVIGDDIDDDCVMIVWWCVFCVVCVIFKFN